MFINAYTKFYQNPFIISDTNNVLLAWYKGTSNALMQHVCLLFDFTFTCIRPRAEAVIFIDSALQNKIKKK